MANARRNHIQNRIGVAQNRAVTGGAIGGGHPARANVGLGQSQPAKKAPAPQTLPGAPGPVAAPWETDPLYVGGLGQAQQGKDNSISSINANWLAKEQSYGFGQFANPYSQAASLARQHDQQRSADINGSGYQLYSGSTVNRLRGADSGYDQNLKGLEAQHNADEANMRREKQEAEERMGNAIQGLKEESLGRAIEEEPEPAPLPGHPRKKANKRKKGKK